MPIRITYLGHSGFIFEGAEHTVVIDPFLTGNDLATMKPGDIRCDYIAVTHGHYDHLGDTIEIARASGATVIAAYELSEYIGSKGVKKTEPMNPGGKITLPFGWVAMTQAFHTASVEGQSVAAPTGIVLHIDGCTIWHLGDTGIFGDMKLLGEIYRPDIACIPIGDRYTMGPELGAMAAEFIRPRYAVPIHYNTWEKIAQDPARTFKPRGVEVRLMAPGEVWRCEA